MYWDSNFLDCLYAWRATGLFPTSNSSPLLYSFFLTVFSPISFSFSLCFLCSFIFILRHTLLTAAAHIVLAWMRKIFFFVCFLHLNHWQCRLDGGVSVVLFPLWTVRTDLSEQWTVNPWCFLLDRTSRVSHSLNLKPYACISFFPTKSIFCFLQSFV